jgi:hypothetical protein
MNICLTVYHLALKAETKAPRFKCAARVAAAQSPTGAEFFNFRRLQVHPFARPDGAADGPDLSPLCGVMPGTAAANQAI